jgi:hypothetical protein
MVDLLGTVSQLVVRMICQRHHGYNLKLFVLKEFWTQESFNPFHIWEDNRTVPAWTAHKYFEPVIDSTTVREYVLREIDQRSYLLCPRGEGALFSTVQYITADERWAI